MTAARINEPAAREVPSDAIGYHLTAVADELGASCVVLESPHGGVLGHLVVKDASPSVVHAVLSRSSAPLHTAMTARGSASVGDGTPAVTGRVDGSAAAVLPIAAMGRTQGWLWVLAETAPDTGALAQLSLRRLGRYLASLELLTNQATEAPVIGAWDPLPNCFTDLSLWVLAAEADGVHDPLVVHELERLIRRVDLKQRITHLVTGGAQQAVLLGMPPEASGRDVCAEVNRALGLAGSNLRVAAVAVQSSVAAALHASHTMLSAPFQGCVTPDVVRRSLLLQQMRKGLAELEEVLGDPLAAILERDRIRHTKLAPALLSWLEADRDMIAAAIASGVHVNTLRYRLKKALEMLGTALSDPAECCEVYIRLLEHMGRTACTGSTSPPAFRSASHRT